MCRSIYIIQFPYEVKKNSKDTIYMI